MKKILISLLTVAAAGAVFAGCAATDVVLKYSGSSLDAIVEAFPSIVTERTESDPYYAISADGGTTLLVSGDYSRTGNEDIAIRTPLKPFTDAGLDTAKLDEGFRADEDTLYVTADYGEGTGKQGSVTDAVLNSVNADRRALTYHMELDHFGIALPGGKIEWAKDYKSNDKDIVFVIAAKPLADIGVDVQNIDGWVFKTMQDENGDDIDVLLKPYDLQ